MNQEETIRLLTQIILILSKITDHLECMNGSARLLCHCTERLKTCGVVAQMIISKGDYSGVNLSPEHLKDVWDLSKNLYQKSEAFYWYMGSLADISKEERKE